jgi:hypothetical protein
VSPTDDVDTPPAVGSPLRTRQVRLLLGAGAAALVLASVGTHLALRDSDEPAPPPLAPTAAFALLGQAQQPRDVVDAAGVKYTVHPETTRLLGEDDLGRVHYLGVGLTGDVCMLTPRDHEGTTVVDAGCGPFPSATGDTVMQLDGPGDHDVSLVADGYRLQDGWRAISKNLVTEDSA